MIKFAEWLGFIGFVEVKVSVLVGLRTPNQPLSVLKDLKFPPWSICKITELISEMFPALLVNCKVVVISLFDAVTVTRLPEPLASASTKAHELETSKNKRITLSDIFIITKPNLSPN